MKRVIKYGLIGFAVLLVLFPGYFAYMSGHMSVSQEIASNVSISSEWTVIKPESPMKTKRDFQSVLLNIEGCKTHGKKSDLILPDGTIVNPELEILDEYGNNYPLDSKSGVVNNYDSESDTFELYSAGFSKKGGELPEDRVYTEVRIRSDKPFVASKIIWYNYNLK
ncbi:MAG TPA: hypothetical protein VGC97_01625 [Pyrinomonadaceae bacterium]|jgi:hypothetical protein